MSEAVDMYATNIGQRSGRPQSEAFERAALKPLVDAVPSDMVAGALTAAHAERYIKAIADKKLATQRSYWKALARFAAWLERRDMITRNIAADCITRRARRDDPLPWQTRAGTREIGRGKPQLRNLSEVADYLRAAAAMHSPDERVAAALPVLTGMASGEVLNLRVGAVDFAARRIWIRGDDDAGSGGDWNVKTGNRTRTVDLPESLVADLERLTDGREATAYVFQRGARHVLGTVPADGIPHGRHWLRSLVRDVCDKAGVRVVPPHGLRGTHLSARLALAGVRLANLGDPESLERIADDLGHGDRGKTARRHYKGAPEHVPALKMVAGGKE